MLEILKSKTMILFMVLVIGVIFIDCEFNKSFKNNNLSKNLITLNS